MFINCWKQLLTRQFRAGLNFSGRVMLMGNIQISGVVCRLSLPYGRRNHSKDLNSISSGSRYCPQQSFTDNQHSVFGSNLNLVQYCTMESLAGKGIYKIVPFRSRAKQGDYRLVSVC